MCQCGQRRHSVSMRTETAGPVRAARVSRTIATATIRYEYTGDTGLTAFGGVTRTRYRFAHGGAQVLADARDASSLDRVPVLRRVPVPRGSGDPPPDQGDPE